jgi:hypothetical protein
MGTSKDIDLISFLLALGALAFVLYFGLLPSLLSGYLVYFMVEFGARFLKRAGLIPATAKMILLALIVLILLGLMTIGTLSLISFLSNGQDSLVTLLQRMADIISASSVHMPEWLQGYVPSDMDGWQQALSVQLRDNASYFSAFGKNIGLFFIHIIFGMLIGGLIAINPPASEQGLLVKLVVRRVERFGEAFRFIVFSQSKISALNTLLTGIFLGVIMPLVGSPLPLVKTMIVVTFIAGLMPVVGNLISNTVICLIALGVSFTDAVAALLFLVVIHKLEYFFNAHIIGKHIKARAWEILLSMLLMDAVFGMPGLIAAPIYYAYVKNELTQQKLI